MSEETAQTLPGSPSDEELVRQVKEGNQAAFDELMERYQQEVITVCYRMLGHYEDAVDTAQEAFFRAYRGLPGFRGQASFRTWLYQITLNLARHRRRWYVRHRVAQTESIDTPVGEEEDPPAERIPAQGSNPREEAVRSELQAAVRQAVARLPEPFRSILVLRDIQEFSYEEMAQICTVGVGTVKSRLHRARMMLKAALAKSKGVVP